jgi:glycosyltransferase involved in cell wall biosynthesis
VNLTVLIPSYNESDSIESLYEELNFILLQDSLKQNYDYELIFIDDGSNDNTLDIIKKLQKYDRHIKYLSFSRNFGKEAAMLAGFAYSIGDAVILIDADLQHPPELIPKMIKYYKDGYDQVIGKRNRTGDSKSKTFLSKLYYKIVNYLIGVRLTDGIGDFRLLSKRAVNAILSMHEYNRFSKGIFSWIGFDSKIIEYENQSRLNGTSKWSFKKLLHYGIDGILSFNDKPLTTTLYFGVIITLCGIAYVLYSLIQILISGINTPKYFTIIIAVLIISGVQLISIGVIGQYVGRIYSEVKMRPHFIIKETNIKVSNSNNQGVRHDKQV